MLRRAPAPGRYINVSVEELKTIRSNLKRSADALEAGIASTFDYARRLKSEYFHIMKSIEDVDLFLDLDQHAASSSSSKEVIKLEV